MEGDPEQTTDAGEGQSPASLSDGDVATGDSDMTVTAAPGEALRLADALRKAGSGDVEARRARAAAKAGLFGKTFEGTRVDRYIVTELLGRGAMGAVYAAHDPKLGRRIALKVLEKLAPAASAELATEDSTEAERSLLREAQALAQVRHPNVIHVYDAGTFEGRIFLTMELIEGETLRSWMEKGAERPWRATVEMLLQAGRGLAAVHDAGLVHRDFKPANVLIGTDGVARVVDFGLARVDPTVELEQTALSTGGSQTVGAGTPAYLAPERFVGEPASVRSDLYSFCVALFEALAGVRPFAGLASLSADPGQAMSKLPASVPAWLGSILGRGLATQPEDRPASMDALIEGLEVQLRADASRTRRRALLRQVAVGAAVVGLGLGSILAFEAVDRSDKLATCDKGGKVIEAQWPERSSAVRDGITGKGLSYAETTAELIEPRLEAWASRWREASTGACIEATLEETMTRPRYERATRCLEVQRAQLEQVLELLAAGEPGAIQNAVGLVTSLPPPDDCTDPDRLRRAAWPAPDQWDATLALQKRLAAAGPLQLAGQHERGMGEAEEIVEEARVLGWEPLVAAALLRQARARREAGDYDAAREDFEAAYFTATRAEADLIAIDAATELASLVGDRLAKPEAGRTWIEQADALLSRGPADPRRQAAVLTGRGDVYRANGQWAEAREDYEAALAVDEALLGPDHPDVAASLDGVANILNSMDDFAEASRLHERARSIRERTLGGDHPDVGLSLNNIAKDNIGMGRYEEAQALLLRALEILEAALGPDHVSVSHTLINLGEAHEFGGDLDAAQAAYERAVAIAEATRGVEDWRLVSSLSSLGFVHRARGELDQYKALIERALVIAEASYGPEHPELAGALMNLGVAYEFTGDYQAAVSPLQRALPLLESSMGPGHPAVAGAQCNLGSLMGKLGRHEESLAYFERCVEIFDEHEGAQGGEGRARFELARALVAHGPPSEHDRAVALARQADADLRARDNADQARLDRIKEWLDQHAP